MIKQEVEQAETANGLEVAQGKSSKPQSFSKLMKPKHLSAVRALGYTLTIGDQGAWWGLVPILSARLSDQERASLAFMTLKSLDGGNASLTAEAALATGAGQPVVPLFSPMDEAAFWADLADREELEAYCLACFNALPLHRQAAFLEFVQGRAAA